MEELETISVERKDSGKDPDKKSAITGDSKGTTHWSDSGVFHSFSSGAVCEFCVGRTQTCGMPTQSLALRLDCLLKPTELGFIAGAPPEEKHW